MPVQGFVEEGGSGFDQAGSEDFLCAAGGILCSSPGRAARRHGRLCRCSPHSSDRASRFEAGGKRCVSIRG